MRVKNRKFAYPRSWGLGILTRYKIIGYYYGI